ncbi:DUF2846 domain-containing protein [Endozoicomonas elysicola]|uniref:DUF2846 domain-containing protein n=1 Tax=Endozoicomonas elysicola TaxID=305900 RepID=A0A081KCL4_9GAMM|nr:DUF2846 domain-containing protein [Endozoicomonas elysicola]KEI71890.1 hypothetical protein GV64_15135 [Endozoicomonas elysicola]
MKTKIFAVIVSLLLGACATAPESAPKYHEADIGAPDNNKAVLVIYRQLVPPVAYKVKAKVNDNVISSLPNQAFTWTYLEPGHYDIDISWPLFALIPGESREITVNAGHYYFIEFSGDMMVAGGTTLTPYSINDLDVIAPKKAIEVLKNCCQYIPSSL